jgi:hypothetical protein
MMPCEGPVRSTRQFLSPGAIKFHEMGVQPRRSLLAAENWTASRRPTGSPSRAGRRTGSVRGQVHAASSWFQSALPSIGCDLSPHSPDDLSGGKLDKAASRRRQGRMASGRTLHARRLHRHQLGEAGGECRRLLQQAWDVRAVDQGGQGSDPMDAALMPLFRRQRRPPSASCPRL